MKYYLINVLMLLLLSAACPSCGADTPVSEMEQPVLPDGNDPDNIDPDEPGNEDESGDDNNDTPMSNKLKITVGSVSFDLTLESNATATAFKALLPMTVSMPDMNSNEKYYYLPENLPTASSNPATIHAGDLMLYGSSCLVLFYETFSTSYSYTRLGRVDNPSGLASALGSGSVTVTFKLQN